MSMLSCILSFGIGYGPCFFQFLTSEKAIASVVKLTVQPNMKPRTHLNDGKEELKAWNWGRLQSKWE